jgi:hypothetical protein
LPVHTDIMPAVVTLMGGPPLAHMAGGGPRGIAATQLP